MFNSMLDKYPEEYKGYLIRTDYRIGIQIALCLSDVEYSEHERMAIAASLLYGNGIPDVSTAMDGLKWFMLQGKEPVEPTEEEVYCDYEYDNALITSAFRKVYGIDLPKAKMHWWEFCMLMGDLGDCAFTQTINIRKKKLTDDMNNEELTYYANAKRLVMLPKKYNPEEQEKIDEFMALWNGGEEDGSI